MRNVYPLKTIFIVAHDWPSTGVQRGHDPFDCALMGRERGGMAR
jgi:hypothetical protein